MAGMSAVFVDGDGNTMSTMGGQRAPQEREKGENEKREPLGGKRQQKNSGQPGSRGRRLGTGYKYGSDRGHLARGRM